MYHNGDRSPSSLAPLENISLTGRGAERRKGESINEIEEVVEYGEESADYSSGRL